LDHALHVKDSSDHIIVVRFLSHGSRRLEVASVARLEWAKTKKAETLIGHTQPRVRFAIIQASHGRNTRITSKQEAQVTTRPITATSVSSKAQKQNRRHRASSVTGQ
jgi:hypothetical protein